MIERIKQFHEYLKEPFSSSKYEMFIIIVIAQILVAASLN